jgi:hypothetical protein
MATTTTTPIESANLILKLYELRREETMREARNFMMSFDPKSVDDYMAGMMGPHSAHIRMVMSYWEMACSFVVSGAIDAATFDETQGEHIFAFAKIEPFLADFRAKLGNPNAFKNLEHVCTSAPSSLERVRAAAARMRGMMAARAAATN